MGIKKPPVPRRLKKLESSDLLSIKDSKGDFLLVTKQETAMVIREFMKNEVINIGDDIIENEKKVLIKRIDEGVKKINFDVDAYLANVEKTIDDFISHKIDVITEKVCTLLINKKFSEEVDKAAEKKILQMKLKGKF